MHTISDELKKVIAYRFKYLTDSEIEKSLIKISDKRKWLIIVKKEYFISNGTNIYIIDISTPNWTINTAINLKSSIDIPSIAINNDEDQIAIALIDEGIKFIEYDLINNYWLFKCKLYTHIDIKLGNMFGSSMCYDLNNNLVISSPFDSYQTFNSSVSCLYILSNQFINKITFTNKEQKSNMVICVERCRTYPNYITLEKVNRSCYYLKSTDYDNPILYSWNDINVRSRRPKSK